MFQIGHPLMWHDPYHTFSTKTATIWLGFAEVWPHTSTPWRMATLGDASKRNLAQAARPRINRRFLCPVAHSLRSWCRTLQGTMSTFPANSGLPSVLTGDNATQQSGSVWRPWAGKQGESGAHAVSLESVSEVKCAFGWCMQRLTRLLYLNFQAHSSNGDLAVAKHPKTPHFIHPVKYV